MQGWRYHLEPLALAPLEARVGPCQRLIGVGGRLALVCHGGSHRRHAAMPSPSSSAPRGERRAQFFRDEGSSRAARAMTTLVRFGFWSRRSRSAIARPFGRKERHVATFELERPKPVVELHGELAVVVSLHNTALSSVEVIIGEALEHYAATNGNVAG